MLVKECGRSSAARMSPFQGEGHGFESRRPLKVKLTNRYLVKVNCLN